MEIKITELNDFIFCPASIYFHKVYGGVKEILYQDRPQIRGKYVHKNVDEKLIKKKGILSNIDVYSEEFGLIGKIDIYDKEKKILIERKNRVKKIYDGYVFQLYAQYYCMEEMGYEVKHLEIHSIEDNKKYKISLPEEDSNMEEKFKKTIEEMYEFDINKFVQNNEEKCKNCIYEPACDRSAAI